MYIGKLQTLHRVKFYTSVHIQECVLINKFAAYIWKKVQYTKLENNTEWTENTVLLNNSHITSFIHFYLQGAEQVTHFCRLLHQHQPLPDNMGDHQLPPQKPLSDSQKLRKVILELIDTERCYVKVHLKEAVMIYFYDLVKFQVPWFERIPLLRIN